MVRACASFEEHPGNDNLLRSGQPRKSGSAQPIATRSAFEDRAAQTKTCGEAVARARVG